MSAIASPGGRSFLFLPTTRAAAGDPAIMPSNKNASPTISRPSARHGRLDLHHAFAHIAAGAPAVLDRARGHYFARSAAAFSNALPAHLRSRFHTWSSFLP